MKRIMCLLTLLMLVGTQAQTQWKLDTLIKITNIETSYPSWSSDGRQLVFQSNRNDDDSEIYVSSDDGKAIRRLTFNPGLDEYPVFSPDNEKIAFASVRNNHQDIYLMDINGKNQLNLTEGKGKNIHPQFSPDGQYLLFNSDRTGDYDLYTIHLATRSIRRLTTSERPDTYAHWSPDGKKIVFVRWVEIEGNRSSGDLFVLDIDSGKEERLTYNTAFDGWPTWSADGEHILFASNRHNGKDFQIHIIDLNGSEITKITYGEQENASYTKPVAAKDGSGRIVCTRTKDGNVEIMIFTLTN